MIMYGVLSNFWGVSDIIIYHYYYHIWYYHIWYYHDNIIYDNNLWYMIISDTPQKFDITPRKDHIFKLLKSFLVQQLDNQWHIRPAHWKYREWQWGSGRIWDHYWATWRICVCSIWRGFRSFWHRSHLGPKLSPETDAEIQGHSERLQRRWCNTNRPSKHKEPEE